MSQKANLLAALKDAGRYGICATHYSRTFYVGRVAARIADLRADGYRIVTFRCREHNHRGRQIRYMLVRDGEV